MSNLGILLTIVAVTYVCAAPPPNKPCICTAEYNPVCGTNGKTYENYACLNCELHKNPTLKKRHDGPCKNDGSHHHQDPAVEKAIPWCACPLVKQLVCGSDVITYGNDCLLKCAAKTKPNLTKVHDGHCKRTDTKVTSCACPKNKQLVCGTDGVTYNNICVLKCAGKTKPGLTLIHEGECKNRHPKGSQVVKRAVPSCHCPMHIQPVCGSDGVTYNNDCLLKCGAKTKHNLTKVHEDPCKRTDTADNPKGSKVVNRSDSSCACPTNRQPVCGTDGVTYGNICFLKCVVGITERGLTLLHEGECKNRHPKGSQVVKRAVPSCHCPMHIQPVCGSDGVTYNNDCLLKCAAKTKHNLRKVHEEPCKKTHHIDDAKVVKLSVPACPCPKNKQIVCGRDGVTYSNICLLKCAARTKPGLTLLHEGECKNENRHPKDSDVIKRSVPACPCPINKQLVCGSDGVTYSNACLLKCAARTKPGLTLRHEGECKRSDQSP